MQLFKKMLMPVTICIVSINILACKPTPKVQATPNNTTQNQTNIKPSEQNGNNFSNRNAQSFNTTSCNNLAIYQAFSQKNENQKTQVLGCGQVKKVLKDDNDGTRHQKFLISIDGYPQITVLVAHNIDLAKRVDNITPNTPIRFYGEYIYNDKGGVLHWTHKDPTARHQDGWLEYNGRKYW